MHYAVLRKNDFNEFVARLAAIEKVVAPVSVGEKSFAFREVVSPEAIRLDYIPTILPPKKYFLPQREKIVEYDTGTGRWEGILEYDRLILLAVHTCDLAGIQCLNLALSARPKDINYLARKNRIAIIGYECLDYCDEHASCHVMGTHLPSGGYDLFFTDLGDVYLFHVNTLLGEELIERTGFFQEADGSHLRRLGEIRDRKRSIFKDEFPVAHADLAGLFARSSGHPVWEEVGRRCVSCANCTTVCPTCYCFDVRDEVHLDLKTGARVRVWDSCQNEPFARVATGENFRKERADRQRHRYERKFLFPFEKYGRYFCTGCGRCTRTCMAGISLKETIATIVESTP